MRELEVKQRIKAVKKPLNLKKKKWQKKPTDFYEQNISQKTTDFNQEVVIDSIKKKSVNFNEQQRPKKRHFNALYQNY